MWIGALVAGIFGCFVGSFCNVVIHRMPRNESVVQPPSRCYACGSAIRWYDNLPILSYLLLRGRCRACGSRYSPRYLFGELAVGLISVGAWLVAYRLAAVPSADLLWPWLFGWHRGVVLALCAGSCLLLGWWLWICAVIDLEHQLIPDELTKPLQVLAPALAVLAPLGAGLGWQATPDWVVVDPLHDGSPAAAPWAGFRQLAWWLVPSVGVLILSLPLAQWIYRSLAAGGEWRPEDLRGLRVGVWWFVGACLLHLAVAAILAALAAGSAVSIETARFLALVDAGAVAPEAVASELVPAGAAWLALEGRWLTAVLGSLLGWGSLYLVGLLGSLAFRRYAMGFGDVKLLAPLGAFLGPVGVGYAFALAALVGALIGIPMRLFGGGREVPFGPYLVIGAVLAVGLGPMLHEQLFGGGAPVR